LLKSLDPELHQLLETERAKLWSKRPTNWLPASKPQSDAYHSPADELLYGGEAGGGKGSPLDALVFTPFGARQIGDLEAGNRICNPAGSNSAVIGVYELGRRQLYRFAFQDGAEVEVTGDHIWKYSVARKQWTKSGLRWKLATTVQLIEMMQAGRRILIPLTRPVQFTRSYRYDYREIPGYVLGALLGDGGLSSPTVCLHTADPEIIGRVRQETALDDWSHTEEIEYRSVGDYGIELRYWLLKNRLLGLRSWEKFIPDQYKHGSIEMRFALVQGLMDTDGYCTPDGKAYYTSVSKQLAQDVQWLVWSLGGRATITDKMPTYTYKGEKLAGRKAYTLYIRMPDNADIFYLPRKRKLAGKYNGGGKGKVLKRRIVSIEPSRIAEARCIKVDHPNGLYVTNDFIVTHNTDLLLALGFNDHRRSVLFRRSYPELEDIIDRGMEMADPQHYKRGAKSWYIPVEGSNTEIHFRYRHLEKPGTETRYQGHAYDGIFFDELTHFLFHQYLYLFSRNRTTIPGQRCRIYSATNPGNEGNDWVVERWGPWLDPGHPHPAMPGDIRWYAQQGSRDIPCEGPEPFELAGETLIPKSRTFIPAGLNDNPYLGDQYRANLQALPEPLRSQLLYGDWSAGAAEDVYQVIPRAWLRAAVDRWHEWKEEQGGVLRGVGAIGVDVGRGSDLSVVAVRRGNILTELYYTAVKDVVSVADLAQIHAARLPQVNLRIIVDVIGIGAGVVDVLARRFSPRVDVYVVAFGAGEAASSTDSTGLLTFANKRAEAWWAMRERLDPRHNPTIALPPDEILFAELTAPKWSKTASDRIVIESKEAIKRRLRRSTDRADAVIQAFYSADSNVLLGWGG
jgi:hypothetical protein